MDPANNDALVDPDVEKCWMGQAGQENTVAGGTGWGRRSRGAADLYVGGRRARGTAPALLPFWHKVLFDLGSRQQ